MGWGTPVVGARSYSSDARGGVTTVLPSYAQGDTLLHVMQSRPGNSFAVVSGTAGWSVLHSVSSADMKVYGKIAGLTEADPTWSCDTAGAAGSYVIRVRGGPTDINDLLDVAPTDDENYGALHDDLTTPAITPVSPNTCVLLLGAASSDVWTPGSIPAGMTGLFSENYTGDFNALWLAAAYQQQAAAATVAASAWDTAASFQVRTNAIALALLPLASPDPLPPGRRVFQLP